MKNIFKSLIYKLIKNNFYYKKYISDCIPSMDDIIVSIINTDKLKLVIDVGANTGQTVESILKINKDVSIHCFEPTPDAFELLFNRFKHIENVRVSNLALGSTLSEATLYTSEFSPTNSLLKPKIESYVNINKDLADILANSKMIKVKQTRFDNYYRDYLNNKVIDIFKTDTQGYDYHVLTGAEYSLNNIKTVIVELQFYEYYSGSVNISKTIEYLYSKGFYLFSIFDVNKTEKKQWIECNALFCNSKFFPI